jgi:hypothetical protein
VDRRRRRGAGRPGPVARVDIANLSLIPGAAAAIAPVGIDRAAQLYNMTALLGLLAAVTFLIVRRGGISRRAGIGLLVFYGAHLAGARDAIGGRPAIARRGFRRALRCRPVV